jgi:hypothetical protein
MLWYPPAMLFAVIPGSWNAFLLLAFVMAASFAYVYVYSLTRSRLAAAVSGLVYSMSGFMMSHVGHVTMLHVAAWIPLLIGALEQLRQRWTIKWAGLAILATVCCLLGGHPQISIYGICLGMFYALVLGWSASVGRWVYYRRVLTIFCLGIALCALQILPTIELSGLSMRAQMTFDQFLEYTIPYQQILQWLFPYFFGGPYAFTGVTDGPYQSPYWGASILAETTGHLGLLPLVLVGIGIIAYRPQRAIRYFWIATACIALLFIFSGNNLLGRLLYQIPIYNKFRGQGRHLVEFSLACSTLAGFGVAAVQARWTSRRFIRKTVLVSALVTLSLLAGIALHTEQFQLAAARVGITDLHLTPWDNPAIGWPLAAFYAGLIIFVLWSRWPRNRLLAATLTIVMAIDLASFGWFWEWRDLSPAANQLPPPAVVKTYRDVLQASHGRFLTFNGVYARFIQPFVEFQPPEREHVQSESVFPNMTRFWQLPSADGYSPLPLARVADMLQMSAIGDLADLPLSTADRSLDLMSVRYLLLPPPHLLPRSPMTVWSQPPLELTLGAGSCLPQNRESTANFDLSVVPDATSEIHFVTTMACAAAIPDGAAVLQVQVTNDQDAVETYALRAGRETAEQAYDCADVLPTMRHQRAAKIFQSTTLDRAGMGSCPSHTYESVVQLAKPQRIKQIVLKWMGQSGVIFVQHLGLVNRATDTAVPLSRMLTTSRWQAVERTSSGVVYENQQAMPRTWLVPETMVLPPAQILQAIRTSRLPDGRPYVPEKVALVEDATAGFRAAMLQPTDVAEIVAVGDTRAVVKTRTNTPAFLVLSDVFYPGWQVRLDGQPAKIFPTNYVQRGVPVPAGEHLVEFRFRPLSFRLGVGITMAAFFGSCVWLLYQRRPQASIS